MATKPSHFSIPLTYVVDVLRYFMLAGSTTNLSLIQDFAVMLVTTAGLGLIGARMYPGMGL